jgi:hypothetical protein
MACYALLYLYFVGSADGKEPLIVLIIIVWIHCGSIHHWSITLVDKSVEICMRLPNFKLHAST